MSYLLDTNICIPFLNRIEAALAEKLRRLSPDDVKLCSTVKAELLYGARCSKRLHENLATLDRFFAALESFPFDDRAAGHYGVVRAQLRRDGVGERQCLGD